jgi:hypothetical protein
MMNVALLILFHNIIPFQFFQTVQTIFFVFYVREATNKSWDVNENLPRLHVWFPIMLKLDGLVP